MADDRAEDIRVAHAEPERAVAAAGLADHAAMLRGGECPVPGIDERHQLLDDVVLVLAKRGRIDVLAPAQVGETIRERQNHGVRPAVRDEGVHAVSDTGHPGAVIQEHPPASGKTAQTPRDGVALAPVFVPGREV